jgi:hypothetical protein
MKIINSFIVDNGVKRFRVSLIKYTTGSRLIRHLYYVNRDEAPFPFLTKFFAKKFFTSLKKGYSSHYYGVYDEIK